MFFICCVSVFFVFVVVVVVVVVSNLQRVCVLDVLMAYVAWQH